MRSDYSGNAAQKAKQFADAQALPEVSDPELSTVLVVINSLGFYLCLGSDPKTSLQLDFDQLDFKLNVRDPLVKAVRINNLAHPPAVLDLTAGWGEDAVHLVQAGFAVTALERHPLVFALLSEAYKRSTSFQIKQNPEFIRADAVDYLQNLHQSVDVIYFDPMFPEKKRKSAAVRKQMSFMQALVGEPDRGEESRVLMLARQKAKHRVIVKRPIKAPRIDGPPPSGCIKGKLVRFDIYSPTGNNL